MHEVLVNRLGGLSLPRKSVDRLTDRPDMTLDVYRGRKTTIQQQPSETPDGELLFLKNSQCITIVNCHFCLACEAEARHMYCFSGVGGGGVNFLVFRSFSRKL